MNIYHLDEKHLLFQGLSSDKPFSFIEVYFMQINCPYCHSEHVVRIMPQPSNHPSQNIFSSSASFATIGATLSKSLPISPLVGGIAGIVVGGLLDNVFGSQSTAVTHSYFHCQHCGQKFY